MRQVTHALLTRPPLGILKSIRKLQSKYLVRLACVRHAASVHPEPGSNSQLKVFVLNPDQHLVDPIRLSDLNSDDLLLGLLSLVFDYF